MRGKAVIILGLSLVLLSCKKQGTPVEYKLSDEQLTHLMYDVQLSDAAITSVSGVHGDTLRELFWNRLSTIYGLSEADIKSEIQKLESDPDKMKSVFDSIKVWSDTIK